MAAKQAWHRTFLGHMRGSLPGPLAVQTVEGQASAPEMRYLQGRKANGHRVESMGSGMDRFEVVAVKVDLLQTTDIPPSTLMMLCSITIYLYNLG